MLIIFAYQISKNMLIYCIIGLIFAIYFLIEGNSEGEFFSIGIGDVYVFLSIILVWPMTLVIHYLGKKYNLDKPFFMIRFKKGDDDDVRFS